MDRPLLTIFFLRSILLPFASFDYLPFDRLLSFSLRSWEITALQQSSRFFEFQWIRDVFLVIAINDTALPGIRYCKMMVRLSGLLNDARHTVFSSLDLLLRL